MTQSKHSTTKHYQQLTPEERGEIEAYLNAGKSQADIARLTSRALQRRPFIGILIKAA